MYTAHIPKTYAGPFASFCLNITTAVLIYSCRFYGGAAGQFSPGTRPDSVGSVQSATSDSASSGFGGGGGGGRGPQRGHDICVGEELKIAIDLAIERFIHAPPDEYQGKLPRC